MPTIVFMNDGDADGNLHAQGERTGGTIMPTCDLNGITLIEQSGAGVSAESVDLKYNASISSAGFDRRQPPPSQIGTLEPWTAIGSLALATCRYAIPNVSRTFHCHRRAPSCNAPHTA